MIALLLALALPNLTLTPGVVRPLTMREVCTTKWGLDRRHVTAATRARVFQRYGIPRAAWPNFIIDHYQPRENGGSDSLLNLWPQPKAESHRKDRVENFLHRQVCAGAISLEQAHDDMRHWSHQ